MSTSEKMITPNKLEVAKKQMSKFIDKIEVPEKIKEREKGFYHVMIVDGTFNPRTLETEYNARVQIFNDRAWIKRKGNLKQLGYDHVFILHDAELEKQNIEEAKDAENKELQKEIDRLKEEAKKEAKKKEEEGAKKKAKKEAKK